VLAQNAYIKNWRVDTVSVIDTATDTVLTTIPVDFQEFTHPYAAAVTPDGTKVYVTEYSFSSNRLVSVIDTATDTVVAAIPISGPRNAFAAVTPDSRWVYVTHEPNSVSVVDTATNTVLTTISVGTHPHGVAVTPDGSKVYVVNNEPFNVVGSVSVIDTATNTVLGSPIRVGAFPDAFGLFIQPPAPRVEIVDVSASPNVLWPPNHKLVDVTLDYRAVDSSGQTPVCASSATSNDPRSDTSDVAIVDPHHLKLRASKAVRGGERAYLVVITCHNNTGHTATAHTTVTVAHSAGR